MSTRKTLFLFLILTLTGCNLVNSGDRIFLDFYLGMSRDEYSNHMNYLVKKNKIFSWKNEGGSDFAANYNQYYNFFDHIYGFIRSINELREQNRNEFFEEIDGRDMLVYFEILIFKDETLFESDFNDTDLSVIEKDNIVRLLIDKYGNQYEGDTLKMTWSFPSKHFNRYYCTFDLEKSKIYYYGDLDLVDSKIKERINNENQQELRKIKKDL